MGAEPGVNGMGAAARFFSRRRCALLHLDLKCFGCILLFLLLSSCSSSQFTPSTNRLSGNLSLITLNIHYFVPDNDKTDWESRKYAVSSALRDLDADIVLFQEMETFRRGHFWSENIQLEWVQSTVEGYRVGAVGNPETFPITQPILYRDNKFRLMDQGFIFFSDTPDQAYSPPWRGRFPAFATWILLQDRGSGKEFYVYNIHLDAFHRKNRTQGVSLIMNRIGRNPHSVQSVVLAGDFNATAGSGVLRRITDSGFHAVPLKGSSFHFGIGMNLYPSIDHVFYSDDFTLVESGVVQKRWNGEWPSDHHPVYASFRIN